METIEIQALFEMKLYGKVIDGITLKKENLGTRLQEWAGRRPGDKELKLAYIYGYTHRGGHYHLPEPIAYIVAGPDQSEKGFKGLPEGEYQTWQVDPADPSIQFLIQPGTFGELLLELEEAAGPPVPHQEREEAG